MIKTYVIIGLVFALVAGGLYSYASNMREQRDRKTEKLELAEKKIETMTQLAAAQEQAIIKLQAKERQNDADQETIRGKIRQAPQSDNAPVAPVLARTFDELRRVQR